MRKTLVIAVREYQAAVRTKTFLISLVLMPIMASAGLIAAVAFKDVVNLQDKRIAVIDGTGRLYDHLVAAADKYNRTDVFGSVDTGEQTKPRFALERIRVNDGENEGYATLDDARVDLSDRVRRGELAAFVEIGSDVFDRSLRTTANNTVTYYSNNPMDRAFAEWLDGPIQSAVREHRFEQAGLSADAVTRATTPVPIEHDVLFTRAVGGQAIAGRKNDNFVHIAAGLGMSLLLSMVVLVGAMPLTYSVLEEKIQRSAEVLLGSATPFQFMLGKLLGMVGVSLTIVTIYLVVGFLTADYFGYGHSLPRHLVYWFVLYQAAAIFMFGSIFIAIGAACNDMKDAQNLMTPASLIACVPLFLIRPVMLEPDSAFAVWASFFPPATPMLMLLRLSLPMPVPAWQPVVGLLLVAVTAVCCVAVAGRIFRVGILMQGQGANIRELFHWTFSREGRSRLRPNRRHANGKASLSWTRDENPAV